MATKARGRDFWEPHIASLRSSGQTSAAYAREHDVSLYALGWWRRKLNRSSPAGAAATEVVKAPKFVALKVTEPMGMRHAGVTISIAGEVRLQMSELPPPAWLAAVSEALRGSR